jgi:hypothetical protein
LQRAFDRLVRGGRSWLHCAAPGLPLGGASAGTIYFFRLLHLGALRFLSGKKVIPGLPRHPENRRHEADTRRGTGGDSLLNSACVNLEALHLSAELSKLSPAFAPFRPQTSRINFGLSGRPGKTVPWSCSAPPGPVKIDRQLVAFDHRNITFAEFLVEDAVAVLRECRMRGPAKSSQAIALSHPMPPIDSKYLYPYKPATLGLRRPARGLARLAKPGKAPVTW